MICKRPLITDAQTINLDWLWCLLLFAALGKAEQMDRQMDGQMDRQIDGWKEGQIDGRYQAHYLPAPLRECFCYILQAKHGVGETIKAGLPHSWKSHGFSGILNSFRIPGNVMEFCSLYHTLPIIINITVYIILYYIMYGIKNDDILIVTPTPGLAWSI